MGNATLAKACQSPRIVMSSSPQMPSMPRFRPAKVQMIAAALSLGVLASPNLACATALDLFFERALMVAANDRCGLFTPPIAVALNAAKAQARGASLRSGVEEDRLVIVEQQAATRAGSVDCSSRDLGIAAGRVRQAFAAFSRLTSVDYPGEVASWRAQHVAPAAGQAGWGLMQSTRFGWDQLTFGVAVAGNARPMIAVATFADGARPYAARLVMRDRARAPRPYLDQRLAGVTGIIPLARRLPPSFATQSFSAEARSAAGRDLLPTDIESGLAYRFPAAAVEAMRRLDPREAVAVEFVFAGERGDVVRTAYVEVSDFAAGRAFLDLPR